MASAESSQAELIVNITGYKGSGITAAIAKLRGVRPDLAAQMGIYSPDEQVSAYASAHRFPLHTQGDYGRAHEQLKNNARGYLVDTITGLAGRHPLVVIDGLRDYTQAQELQKHFPDTYRTLKVECPLGLRYLRIARMSGLDPRDVPRHLQDIGSFAADEQSGLARLYPWRVMGMHDLGPAPIDGAQTRLKVAEAIARPIAVHLGVEPVLRLPEVNGLPNTHRG